MRAAWGAILDGLRRPDYDRSRDPKRPTSERTSRPDVSIRASSALGWTRRHPPTSSVERGALPAGSRPAFDGSFDTTGRSVRSPVIIVTFAGDDVFGATTTRSRVFGHGQCVRLVGRLSAYRSLARTRRAATRPSSDDRCRRARPVRRTTQSTDLPFRFSPPFSAHLYALSRSA